MDDEDTQSMMRDQPHSSSSSIGSARPTAGVSGKRGHENVVVSGLTKELTAAAAAGREGAGRGPPADAGVAAGEGRGEMQAQQRRRQDDSAGVGVHGQDTRAGVSGHVHPSVVPTRIIWRYGGTQVFLCGSFTRWIDTIPMHPLDTSGAPSPQGDTPFVIDINLPLGYHQFKFIVDGKWRHDDALPVVQDPLGNLNNWVHVPQDIQHIQMQAPSQVSQPGVPGSGTGMVHAHGDHDVSMYNLMSHELQQQQQQHSGAGPADVNMDWASSAPPVPQQHTLESDRAVTIKKISEFFTSHTAYELIPESGKVIVLDVDLTLKQAFHALYEQSISSAPLWDSQRSQITGMISPSDFIVLQRLLHSQDTGGGATEPAEMELERQTIRSIRDSSMPEGFVRPLLSCEPGDSLASCVVTLTQGAVSAIPIMHYDSVENDGQKVASGGDGCAAAEPTVGTPHARASSSSGNETGLPVILHLASLSDVFGMLLRFFRTSMASLPLLGHPIGSLGIGTWVSGQTEAGGPGSGGIHTIGLDMPLLATLQLLITADVGALPVVDAGGAVQEVYGRSDVIALALDSAYRSVDWETTSVSQALSHVHDAVARSTAAGKASGTLSSRRCALVTRAETLRGVIERLSMSGVRRVICVDSSSRRVEGIITLRDVATYLLSHT